VDDTTFVVAPHWNEAFVPWRSPPSPLRPQLLS
jgi:hypothetical protein